MAPKKKQAVAPSVGTKRTRTAQPGITAALAAAAAAGPRSADLVLETAAPRDLLDSRLTDELTSNGDKYLQA